MRALVFALSLAVVAPCYAKWFGGTTTTTVLTPNTLPGGATATTTIIGTGPNGLPQRCAPLLRDSGGGQMCGSPDFRLGNLNAPCPVGTACMPWDNWVCRCQSRPQ